MRKAGRIEQCHHCKGPMKPDEASRVQVPTRTRWYDVVLLCNKCTMDRRLIETMKGTIIQ